MKLKDIFYVFEGPELSDGFPGVAHHVADDVWLDGVALLTYFQLCLVLGGGRQDTVHAGQPNYEVQFYI